jgi:hypothetical protein
MPIVEYRLDLIVLIEQLLVRLAFLVVRASTSLAEGVRTYGRLVVVLARPAGRHVPS